ncbi:MAG: hypothetical protein JNL43_13410 [Flavobacteriales bacterium]|nr:hypothetical protein [Flavobacteriales bacterium]
MEYRIDYAMDLTRHAHWVKKLGKQRGAEFSHMMHERKRLLNIFLELCVLLDQPQLIRRSIQHRLPLFVGVVKDSFWREVLIGLSRFGDVPMPGHIPISLPSWSARHMKRSTPDQVAEFMQCLREFETALRSIKRIRNRYLAHSDARNIQRKDPSRASIEQVEHAFVVLDKALRIIEQHHGLVHVADMPYPSSLGGAQSFIELVINSPLEDSWQTMQTQKYSIQ